MTLGIFTLFGNIRDANDILHIAEWLSCASYYLYNNGYRAYK